MESEELGKDKDIVENSELLTLINGLSITRKELQNIRKDVRRLNNCYEKDVDSILKSLKSWKCESCCKSQQQQQLQSSLSEYENGISLEPIGVISSAFTEKKGTPRQPGICINSRGKITVYNTVFTNPDHALQGLEEFSHMWILFHFHRNDSTHIRAKVAPPRLNGVRTGVFGTRSPHRPSPIGLSLVRIDRVEGASVFFSGVDMLDGTPVLDIKPYIPQYDNPSNLMPEWNSVESLSLSADRNEMVSCVHMTREAPDGEECAAASSSVSTVFQSGEPVRVPQWISEPIVDRLTVKFKEKAKYYLDSLKADQLVDERTSATVEDIENVITRVLEEDPRSVYVRERYGNQFYTFLIGNHHVSCKFDDVAHSVHVYKVVKASPLSEWKVSFEHSDQENN